MTETPAQTLTRVAAVYDENVAEIQAINDRESETGKSDYNDAEAAADFREASHELLPDVLDALRTVLDEQGRLRAAITQAAADARKAEAECAARAGEDHEPVFMDEDDAMAKLYGEAADTLEGLLAPSDTTSSPHALVGKTIVAVSERQMIGKDTMGDYHDWTETTLTLSDGTTHTIAEDNTDTLGDAREAQQCRVCGDTIISDAGSEWFHPFGYSISEIHDPAPQDGTVVAVELAPCAKAPDGTAVRLTGRDGAEFWTIYLRVQDGETTRAEAQSDHEDNAIGFAVAAQLADKHHVPLHF